MLCTPGLPNQLHLTKNDHENPIITTRKKTAALLFLLHSRSRRKNCGPDAIHPACARGVRMSEHTTKGVKQTNNTFHDRHSSKHTSALFVGADARRVRGLTSHEEALQIQLLRIPHPGALVGARREKLRSGVSTKDDGRVDSRLVAFLRPEARARVQIPHADPSVACGSPEDQTTQPPEHGQTELFWGEPC